jgi:hypothetical protein
VLSVSQEIDATLELVTNRVAWRLGGLRLAASAPARAEAPQRLTYRFASLTLSAGERTVLAVQLGPRGPGGWSESTYLDGDTRIVRNSRGDMLVLQRSAAPVAPR